MRRPTRSAATAQRARSLGPALLAVALLLCTLTPPRIASARWRVQQQAKGAVNAGKLKNASRLVNSRYVKLRFPKNAWGTRRLVDLIQQCGKHVGKVHRGAHRLLVGDLSRRTGGPLRPHAGHQNGREADIGFYMRSGKPLGGLWRVSAGHIDARRTLTFIECFRQSGELMNVFMDRALQPALVREAKRRKWSAKRISAMFSWPRGKYVRQGVVQHRGGHDNHIHVRIRCAKHERSCRDRPVSRRRMARIRRRHR